MCSPAVVGGGGGGGGGEQDLVTLQDTNKNKRVRVRERGEGGVGEARGWSGRYLAKVEGSSLLVLPTTEALCSFSFSTPFISQGGHFNEDEMS